MTDDEKAGIAWWNDLVPWQRAYWCAMAKTAAPFLAWEYFKAKREAAYAPSH